MDEIGEVLGSGKISGRLDDVDANSGKHRSVDNKVYGEIEIDGGKKLGQGAAGVVCVIQPPCLCRPFAVPPPRFWPPPSSCAAVPRPATGLSPAGTRESSAAWL